MLAFGAVELGGGTGVHAGELRTSFVTLSSASLRPEAWSVVSATLDTSGSGTVVLSSAIELSTALQPGPTIDGEARLRLTFVPEPGAIALPSGLVLLGVLARTRRRGRARLTVDGRTGATR